MNWLKFTICNLFGHELADRPIFTERGKYSIFCSRRCGFKREGDIPPQHQHVYGNKKHKASFGYFYECGCGHTIDAPAPVKRIKKGEAT